MALIVEIARRLNQGGLRRQQVSFWQSSDGVSGRHGARRRAIHVVCRDFLLKDMDDAPSRTMTTNARDDLHPIALMQIRICVDPAAACVVVPAG